MATFRSRILFPPLLVLAAVLHADPATVKDPFFGYLIGIIHTGMEMEADSARLHALRADFGCGFEIPFDRISRVAQHGDPGTGDRFVRLDFLGPMDVPIPYSLLFYHPGRIRSDSSVVFRVSAGTYDDSDTLSETSRVYILELVHGCILVDIDDWLELLFPSHLEDAWIRNVVFFTWDGRWMGMLQGTGRSTGRMFRSFFDFTRNAIVSPLPAPLDRAGRSIIPDS
jgi:hypothetical protein